MNLAERAWSLLTRAQEVYADSPAATHWLRRHAARFGEPPRVAVAGPQGAGSSTLVAALLGEAADGRRQAAPMSWQHLPADAGWPELLVLDASASAQEAGPRVADALRMEADAVLYLAPHPHEADLALLRAAHDHPAIRLAPVNVLAVLARADELGGGRVDALISARRVARRWAAEAPLAELCQDVVAVAGLAALAARTLRPGEFELLAALAAAPKSELDPLLLSADRFGADPDRAELLGRFGLYGVRLATTLIRGGRDTPRALSAELGRRSGLDALGEAVSTYVARRAPVLKARSALLGLDVVLRREPRPSAAPLVTELERTLTGAHELAELRLFSTLRTGRVSLPEELGEEAARLVGGYGEAPQARLAVDAPEPALRQAAAGTLRRWRGYAENPVFGSAERLAASTVVRTCEALVTEPL
ncbi:hypothetical protein B1813_12595 [Saccharomonospora piscinae]|uniref:Dynamin family protein n=1 Tax=Saccharomonospora piscinae TaxID=687388 RepID=A0A1V9A7C5_SACPI|nr:hypothetical protein [Saccharomonospora piscinae]OQO92948.1 hypothetical protein B1813_12595 [Saccharomonospora piscinae]